jgi:hypothetical protein
MEYVLNNNEAVLERRRYSGTIATGQWATLTNGSLALTGGSYTLSGLADLSGTSLQISAGAALSLPGLAQGSLALSNGRLLPSAALW